MVTKTQSVWDMANTLKVSEWDVTVFLINGVKLTGIITDIFNDGIHLTRDGVTQIVLNHSIATIMPQQGY